MNIAHEIQRYEEGLYKIANWEMRNHIKYPSIQIYQKYARIYLDEYPEQKEERLSFFMRRWNLKSNQGIRKLA